MLKSLVVSHQNTHIRSIPPLFSVVKMRDRRRRQILLQTNADWWATLRALYLRDDVSPPEPIYRGGMPITFQNTGTPPSLFWPTGTIQVSYLSEEELEELMDALRLVLVSPSGEALLLEEMRRDPSYGEIRAIYDEYGSGLLALRLRYPLIALLLEEEEEDARDLMELQLINDLWEATWEKWISIKRMIRMNFDLESTMGAIRSNRKLTEIQLVVFNKMKSYGNAATPHDGEVESARS